MDKAKETWRIIKNTLTARTNGRNVTRITQARQDVLLWIAILEAKVDNNTVNQMNSPITQNTNQDSCQGIIDVDEEIEESLTRISDNETPNFHHWFSGLTCLTLNSTFGPTSSFSSYYCFTFNNYSGNTLITNASTCLPTYKAKWGVGGKQFSFLFWPWWIIRNPAGIGANLAYEFSRKAKLVRERIISVLDSNPKFYKNGLCWYLEEIT